ncbi:bifunctional diguanylate cyclase/phosphodiesterase [Pseudoduganella umbonata]|uniref:EAL domain-containing protein n=1 Tax=Pseudoduganella umbonata TaxID=864828 RepID=A0A4P8HJV0_9BURK|nr:EAL domain-containing protein [Pseudoduganella umbonata]MBB3219786.1 PAS domain S-box-containing protein [Pseudoduganella umbonata]QCP09827.1 EAL domain-containing protein [Pseudoduganella umbonata]
MNIIAPQEQQVLPVEGEQDAFPPELVRLAAHLCGSEPPQALDDECALLACAPPAMSPEQRQALADLAATAAACRELKRKLARAESFLSGFAEHSPSPLWIKDRSGSYVMGNAALHGFFGVPTVVGMDDSHFWPEDIRHSLEEQDRAVLENGETIKTMETSHDGTRHWLVHKFPIDVDGEPFLGGSAIDMTTEVEKERALIRHDNFYVLLSRLSAIITRARTLEALCMDTCRFACHQPGLEVVDISRVDDATGALELFTSAGRDGTEHRWHDMRRAGGPPEAGTEAGPVADWCARELADAAVATGRLQVSNHLAGTQQRVASCMAIPLFVNGKCWGAIAFYSHRPDFFDHFYRERAGELGNELSFGLERLINAQELFRLARTNALSGLPSRLHFDEEVAALAAVNASGTVLLININRFDEISSAYGNTAAIGLMRQVAQRLKTEVAPRMALSHVGIGRFALFYPVDEARSPRAYARDTIIPMLEGSYQVDEQKIWCTVNVGAAMLPEDGTSADELLVKAWDALAGSRAQEEQIGFYDRDADHALARQISMEAELREAVERGEFINFYQPKIDLKTGKLAGAEALVRWRHPQRGLIQPTEFVPVLERSGLVTQVGRNVMQRAMEDWRAWHDAGLKPPQIAVNVAPAQFRCDSLFDDIERALNTAEASLRPLSIEVTESGLVADQRRVVDILNRVRELDVPVAIDDFGTGYSSLAYLVTLPVDVLKIDRSFVVKMTQDANYMGMVQTIVQLAHTLELKVVAEGIETEEEAKFLKLLRCEQGQGYLYGRPLPAEEFARLLQH